MEIEVSTEENVVEIIREGLRELASTERKEKRQRVVNKNRVALGNIVSDSSFTTQFVIEKAKALKKKALPTEEYKQLQNALIQNEENVNAFLKVNNTLFALARDVSGKDPIVQLCAMNCCCNIALGNVKACTSLAKSVGSYIITELDTLNNPLLEVCIWTMGNLIAGSPKAFEIFQAQDCSKYIISLMKHHDDLISSAVAYCAMHYVHTGFQIIGENEMVELAKATAGRSLSFESPYFVWLLALLSSLESYNIYVYNKVPYLIDYLHQNIGDISTTVTEITACIRVLANTVPESSGNIAKCLLENPKYSQSDTGALFDKLLSCRYQHVRKETLWLLGNLYNHNVVDIRNAIQGMIPQLSSLEQAIFSTTQSIVSVNVEEQECRLSLIE